MIEGVNDAPLSQNVLLDDLIEDTEYLGTLQGEDLEEDRITFFITIEPNHGTFRFIEGLGNYSYIPDDNFFGLDSFFYEISDGEDTSIEYKTTLNINGVNDVPTSENTIFNDVIEDTQYSGIIFGNDIENDPIEFIITNNTDNGILNLSNTGDGEFTFLPNNNFFGLDTFSYVLSDGIDTSIEYIGIFNVAAINDAPVMDEIEDQIIDEDTFLEYILNTQDVENDSILYSATIANPDFLIEINIDTLTIYPPENWFGSIDVDVFATEFNQDPLLDSASFNLIVNSVDDLPFVFESINEISLTEDFNY